MQKYGPKTCVRVRACVYLHVHVNAHAPGRRTFGVWLTFDEVWCTGLGSGFTVVEVWFSCFRGPGVGMPPGDDVK